MLITTGYVQTNFPEWGNFFIDELKEASSAVLENDISRAEDELREYLPGVTADNITEGIRRHLFNIVVMNGSRRIHMASHTEIPPLIVKEYENSISALKLYSTSDAAPEDKKHRISVKSGRFDSWFDENED